MGQKGCTELQGPGAGCPGLLEVTDADTKDAVLLLLIAQGRQRRGGEVLGDRSGACRVLGLFHSCGG